MIFSIDGGGIRLALLDMAQRLADAGYLVLLPDLFYRYGPYGPFVPKEVFAGDFRAILGLLSWRALEATVAPDHILGRIDRQLDTAELRHVLAPHYSHQGRPSIAPELFIRMALIGRLYGITSERRLCEEVRFNLALRRFCRLPLDARMPHQSTFSKNRHRRFRDAGVFRLLYENTVRRCIAAGLVFGKSAPSSTEQPAIACRRHPSAAAHDFRAWMGSSPVLSRAVGPNTTKWAFRSDGGVLHG